MKNETQTQAPAGAHTPTPWRRPFTSDTGTKIFDSCNSLPIVQCYPPFFRPGTEPQQDPLDVARENAALIVRAVNSHAALVEACERLVRTCQMMLPAYGDSKYASELTVNSVRVDLVKARAALALAKP